MSASAPLADPSISATVAFIRLAFSLAVESRRRCSSSRYNRQRHAGQVVIGRERSADRLHFNPQCGAAVSLTSGTHCSIARVTQCPTRQTGWDAHGSGGQVGGRAHAFVVIREGEAEYHAMVEIDRGTMSIRLRRVVPAPSLRAGAARTDDHLPAGRAGGGQDRGAVPRRISNGQDALRRDRDLERDHRGDRLRRPAGGRRGRPGVEETGRGRGTAAG
jgi:hypothetical protein